MKLKALGAVIVLMIGVYFFPRADTSDQETAAYLANEITLDGQAIFYLVQEDIRKELWSVHCRQPMRGCVARTSGLVLRLDENAQPWLLAAVSHKARISLKQKNYTQDGQGLFSKPLTPSNISRLSTDESFVVIEENGVVLHRIRTTGLAELVSYLTWIHSETARTLRDARLWPRNDSLSVQNMTPEVLQRYNIMRRRAIENQRLRIRSADDQLALTASHAEETSF